MIYLTALLIYLFTLAGVGIYKSRQVKTGADFSVAGRSLSPWILVCTMLAAWIGTGSIVGNAGKTYQTGLAALILLWGQSLACLLEFGSGAAGDNRIGCCDCFSKSFDERKATTQQGLRNVFCKHLY